MLADSPDGMLAEIVEIQNHPYMIATQAHPERNITTIGHIHYFLDLWVQL